MDKQQMFRLFLLIFVVVTSNSGQLTLLLASLYISFCYWGRRALGPQFHESDLNDLGNFEFVGAHLFIHGNHSSFYDDEVYT